MRDADCRSRLVVHAVVGWCLWSVVHAAPGQWFVAGQLQSTRTEHDVGALTSADLRLMTPGLQDLSAGLEMQHAAAKSA